VTDAAEQHQICEVVLLSNARLIAAAPERVCDTYGFDASTDSSIWQEAFAALAKARGEA
jgi:hypothetical protein